MRVVLLESRNRILDLILPFVIFSFIGLLYFINKRTDKFKFYFHSVALPIVGLLSARKTISQNNTHFYLNESFASWLIMIFFGSFSSPLEWHRVVGLNFVCFFSYIAIIFWQYGIQGVNNDFYVHITTTIIFQSCLIRMNEYNLRSSYNLLSLSKQNEQKWQRVLNRLTDGVLILDHVKDDSGITLINNSLKKILKSKKQGNESEDESVSQVNIETPSNHRN